LFSVGVDISDQCSYAAWFYILPPLKTCQSPASFVPAPLYSAPEVNRYNTLSIIKSCFEKRKDFMLLYGID
jgi:hypothetical protein